ncbi:MAG TPA: hypothetical protein VLH94_00260 [Spirochaetia bacterium]|nr:hypothetical protein [Spirochaetia bacterium]
MNEREKRLLDEKKNIERSRESCFRVMAMLQERPWIRGEVIETVQNSRHDRWGIDMYVPVDHCLTDLLCMKQEKKGIKVQVKSGARKEHEFWREHKKWMLSLSKGENIFVINGQEKHALMLATLIGQMVAMSSLTGSIPENVFLGFMAEDLRDEEAVLAYIENKDWLIHNKWFGGWLDGSKID